MLQPLGFEHLFARTSMSTWDWVAPDWSADGDPQMEDAGEGAAAAAFEPCGAEERAALACGGLAACPWCGLGVAIENHNAIDHAVARYMELQAAMVLRGAQPSGGVNAWINLSQRMQLIACAIQYRDAVPEEQAAPKLVRMQGENMLPASLGVAELHATVEAIKSCLSDGSSGGAGGGGRNKKKKSKFSWDDPLDAPWRLSEDWIYNKPGHRRYIKVNCGARQGWLTLPPGPTQQLLEWYDESRLGDEIFGVMTDLENQHAYNYRIEGGMYLTQRNPNRENTPRECHIFYGPV